MIGRGSELARATAALEGGQGRLIVVSGPAGIGKSTLLAATAEAARDLDFLVLTGRAPLLATELSYAPVIEALGGYVASLPSGRAAALVRSLPDLARLFPIGQPPPEVADPDLARTRLFDAVARLLERLTADRPVLLAVDDVPVADAGTRDLLVYLTGALRDRPFTLAVTQRTGDHQVVARLRAAAAAVTEIELDRLTPPEAAQLAETELAGVDLALLDDIERRAAGVPLFITGLARQVRETGELTAPPVVRDLVLARINRRPPAERRLIDLLSLHAEPADHGVLLAAADTDEPAFLAATAQLRDAGLVEEDAAANGPVRYRLAHPLTAEVAAAALTEVERRRLHLALAQAVEATGGDLNRQARHYRAAGGEADPERVVGVLLAAAHRAEAAAADRELLLDLETAAELIRDGHQPDALADVLARLGQARRRHGDHTGAIQAWTEAAARHEAAGATAAAAEDHRWLAVSAFDAGDFAAADGELDQAFRLGGDLARLWQTRITFLERQGDVAGIRSALVELRRRPDSPVLTAVAAMAEAGFHAQRGEWAEAVEQGLTALTAAEQAGDVQLLLPARELLANLMVEEGDHRVIRAYAEPLLDLAVRAGPPGSEMRARGCLAVADFMAGRWDDAELHLEATLAIARRAGVHRGIVRSQTMQAMVKVFRGDLAAAEARLADARAGGGLDADIHLATTAALTEAFLALELGDTARAAQLADVLETPGGNLLHRRLAVLAIVHAAAGQPEAAAAVLDRLRSLARPDDRFDAALIARSQGILTGSRDAFAAAADGFAAVEAGFEEARARLEWAQLAPAGDADAIAAAQESLAAFDRIGAARWADRARRVLRSLGARAPRRRSDPTEGPLSRRELEVARLAAGGLTTNEIAERLVISRHTAATHLQHIYARLDVSSRVALARSLADAGLL